MRVCKSRRECAGASVCLPQRAKVDGRRKIDRFCEPLSRDQNGLGFPPLRQIELAEAGGERPQERSLTLDRRVNLSGGQPERAGDEFCGKGTVVIGLGPAGYQRLEEALENIPLGAD